MQYRDIISDKLQQKYSEVVPQRIENSNDADTKLLMHFDGTDDDWNIGESDEFTIDFWINGERTDEIRLKGIS